MKSSGAPSAPEIATVLWDMAATNSPVYAREYSAFPAVTPQSAPSRGAVLLVDDDCALLAILARALRAQGYNVTTAHRAEEAVRLIGATSFDVVVSDISMPGMSGIQLLRRARETDRLVPFVLMTGQPAVDTAAEAVEYGAFRYLTKPVTADELTPILDRAVWYHRMGKMKQHAAQLLGVETAGPGDRAGLEASFKNALNTLWVAYQPIVDATTRSIFGYEALLRTAEPSLPHPGAVIDAAERMDQLDVLGRAIRRNAALPMIQAHHGGMLFVNLHVRDLLDPTLLDPEAPLSKIASRVVLEITERSALDEVGDVHARIAELREMGFRIAIDDLGAGYAGLTSFAQLEPEVVKLDMSLIRGIDCSATKQRIVLSMTALCRDMGMLVVGEGVETTAERDTLVSLGCDLLQGFLFSRPSPPFPEVRW